MCGCNKLHLAGAIAATALFLGFYGQAGFAQTYYFDQNGSTAGDGIVNGSNYSWNTTATDWSTSSAGTLATVAVNWSANPNTNVVYFGGMTGDTAGWYYTATLPGSFLTIGGMNIGSVAGGTLTLAATSVNFAMQESQTTWTINSGSTLIDNMTGGNGAVNLSSHTLTLAGGGNVTIAGSGLDNAGTLTDNLTGTLTLNAPGQNFTSATTVTVNSGTLAFGNSGALGVGSTVSKFTIGGGTIDNTSGGPSTLTTGAITISNSFAFLGTNSLNLGSAAVTLSANPTITVVANTLTIPGAITGAHSLTLAGSGTLLLSGNNGYSGGTIVNTGTLQLGNNTGLGSASGALTVGSGTVDLHSYSPTVGSISGPGLIVNNASNSLSTLTVNLASGSNTFSGNLANGAGALALAVSGNGILALANNNSYSGGTTISSGTLAVLSGGALGSGNVAIVPGGVLDVSALGSSGYSINGGVLTAGRTASYATDINGNLNVNNATINVAGVNTVGTLTINGSLSLSGGTLAYDAGDQIAVAGSGGLVLGGGTSYILPSSALTPNTYTLFTYNAGDLTGGTANMAMGGSYNDTRQSYVFGLSGGTAMTLTVSGSVGSLKWTGLGNGIWDSTQASANWYNQTSGSADVFYASDSVTFDDTASSGAVTVNGAVPPSSLNVNNTALNYTFTGTGSITGGTSLVKNGAGSLTIGTSNTYSGGTFVHGGIVNANAYQALGTGALVQNGGTLSVNNGQSISSATVSAGQLNVNANAALGTGLFTISGGTIDSTAGGVTMANGAQSWSGSFTYNGSTSLNMGAAAVAMTGSTQVTVNANTLTIGGPISGMGFSLTKEGAGTMVLAGNNAYNSGTTIGGGILSLANAGALGSAGTITFGGGTLQYSASNTADYSSRASSAANQAYNIDSNGQSVTWSTALTSSGGSLTKYGAGNLTLNADSTYTGSLAVMGGTITCPGGDSGNNTDLGENSGSRTIAVNSGATLLLTTNNVFYGGGQTASGLPTIVIGGGLMNSTRYNAIGNVNLNGGTLNQAATDGSGTSSYQGYQFLGTITVAGTAPSYVTSTLSTNGTYANDQLLASGIVFNVSPTGGTGADLTVSAGLTNESGDYGGGAASSLTKSGLGLMAMTGSSNFTGTTTISAGTLQIGNGGSTGALGGGGGVVDNAVLAFDRNDSGLTFSNAISGNGTIVQAGPGLTLLSGNNSSFFGNTIASGGTLQLGSTSALGYSANLVGAGGTVDLNGNTISLASLSGNGTITDNSAVSGTTTLTVNPSVNSTFGGVLQNGLAKTLALTVNGGSVLTLCGSNTYSGPTTISSGTLALGPSGTLGSGNITISSGAVLDVSARGSSGYTFNSGVLVAGPTPPSAADINGNLNVSNATLSPAGAGNAGTMTIGGNLAFSGGTVSYDQGDQIVVGGTLSLSGTDYVIPNSALTSGTYTLFTFGSLSGGTANLAMGGIFGGGGRQTYAFSISGGTAIDLTAAGGQAGNLLWTGGTNDVWDTRTSASWYNQTSGTTDIFYTGDNVTFDDTAGTVNGNVTINGTVQPGSLTFNNSAVCYTLSGTGSIGGTTSLVLNGPGTLNLGSSNGYSGGTNILGGVLSANAVNSLGSGTVAISGGTLNANAAQSISSIALSSGLLSLNNAGALGASTLTITGGAIDNTSGSAVTLNNNTENWNGDFAFNGTNNLNLGAGPITLGSNRQVTVGGGTLTVGGPISGSGDSLALAGTGTLVLAGSNSYSGGTTISSGVLSLANAGALGSVGMINFGGGILQYSASNTVDYSSRASDSYSQAYNIDTNGQSVTWNSALTSPGGSLTKYGAGTLMLNVANTFTGDTTVNGGTLQLNGPANTSAGALASPTITVNSGGFLALNAQDVLGYTSNQEALVINGGTVSNISASYRVTIQNMITLIGGVFTGAGVGDGYGVYSFNTAYGFSATSDANGNPAIVSPASFGLQNGNLVFNVTRGPASPASDLLVTSAINPFAGSSYGIDLTGNGVMTLTGSSQYVGATAINGGTLQLGTGAAGQDGSINGTSGVADNAVLAYNLAGTQIVGYGISGYGSLAKCGSGTLVLGSLTSIIAATSTFTGDVTINGGALVVAATSTSNGSISALGGGDSPTTQSRTITVNAGGTLQFDAPNTFGQFYATYVPTLVISGGTVTNADPAHSNAINNALNDVTLISGLLTATTGQHGGYAAWNLNGTVTSSGNSFITTSDPVYGTVMLGSNPIDHGTTFNITDGTLAISAPVVQDNVDGIVDTLTETGNGTLILSAANKYSGGTNVSSGTLVLDGASSLLAGSSLMIGSAGGGDIVLAPAVASPARAATSELAPVPEPGTLLLLAVAALAAATRLQRRKA